MEAAAKKSEIANSAEELIQDDEKDFTEGESACLVDVSYYYSCINQSSFIYILLLYQFFNELGNREQNGMYQQSTEELQKTALFLRAKAALIDIEVDRRIIVSEEIAAIVLMAQMKKRGEGSSSSSSKDDDANKKAAISTDSQIY